MHFIKANVPVSTPREWSERKRKRKMMSVPNRSLTISQIVERFTKGLDAGVSVAPTSNHPDSEVDLERMSRMDRAEKAYMAEELRLENERKQGELKEDLRRTQEELDDEKKARIAAKKAAAKKAGATEGGPAKTGIDGA